ncbi:MAG: ArsC family reductase [Gammaproteobacteria bacterium]|nr:ArsC family reductase [Gammaproteobacteria bacterium]
MIVIYGIANCDSVKKARKWLNDHAVDYQFHDFKKQGVDQDLLLSWTKVVPWETLLNRRGTTWRALPPPKDSVDQAAAIKIMLASPSVIKRPVLDTGTEIIVGFSAQEYEKLFG